MADLITSPEYAPVKIDDVQEVFETIVAKRPVFSSLIPIIGVARQHKHEWLEHVKTQKSWTVDGNSAAASGTVDFDDTTGMKVYDVLKFVKTTGASQTVLVKITAINSATQIAVTRLGTDEQIDDNATAYLVSRPRAEDSTEDRQDNVKPARAYNYTQIFRRDFALSRTTLQTALYGLETASPVLRGERVQSLVEFQAMNQLNDIAFELNLSLINGLKEERSTVTGVNGRLGGTLEFMQANPESLYNASGAAISATILNNALNQAGENGADGPTLTLMVCHPRQARKISAFNTSGNNPIIVRGDVTAGSYVAQFQSDLGGTNNGSLLTIVADRNFPEDMVAIHNPENLSMVPMQNFFVEETTDKKVDGRQWKILGELTLQFRNAKEESILIYNLAL